MLRLATRSSKLALAQCEGVAELLRAAGYEVEPVPIDPREEARGAAEEERGASDDKGRFTRGVERALLEGRADIGVHSAKDLPGALPDGLLLAGAPAREAAADAWVTPESVRGVVDAASAGTLRDRLAALPPGARVGTASLRRRSQLLALRQDLSVEELRGNVDTRLRLMRERGLDAVVLAAAGLRRLGLTGAVEHQISAEEMVPAPGQGALALEVRADDGEAAAAVAAINHETTLAAVRAERALAAGLAADCDTPIGALATPAGERLLLDAYVGRADGGEWLRDRLEGSVDDPVGLGVALAERMIAAGARQVLKRQ